MTVEYFWTCLSAIYVYANILDYLSSACIWIVHIYCFNLALVSLCFQYISLDLHLDWGHCCLNVLTSGHFLGPLRLYVGSRFWIVTRVKPLKVWDVDKTDNVCFFKCLIYIFWGTFLTFGYFDNIVSSQLPIVYLLQCV